MTRAPTGLRQLGLWALVGLAAATVAAAGYVTARETRDSLRSERIEAGDEQFERSQCIQARIDDRIPAGSTIAFVDTYSLVQSGVISGSHPRYQVTERARDADYTVRVAYAADQPCSETKITIRQAP